MKIKFYIPALLLFFASMCRAQENFLKSKLVNMEYVDDVELYENDIYCAGISYKTVIDDGNASYAYINNYDRQTLTLKWSVKVSDEPANIVNSIARNKDKLYVLVNQGTVTSSTRNLHLSLLIMTLKGEVEEKVSIGPSFYEPCNILFEGDNLHFAYQVAEGIDYTSKRSFAVVSYNLKTKKLTSVKSAEDSPKPKKILTDTSGIYLAGSFIYPRQSNILKCKDGKLSKIYLTTNKTEYVLDCYINDKTLTVVCVFPGVYGNPNSYLRYYYINTDNNLVKSVTTLPYKDLGWDEVGFNTFSTGSSTWMIVNDTAGLLKYILLDNKGKVINTLNFTCSGITERIMVDKDVLIIARADYMRLSKF
ncbi:hypothetical protein AM493_13950 [Flavobacterium akiainvivens]|uniref:Uncharacterized protein n=1 Tax=Flavobacterium akiainvivens TaxID=1202724 RepID=A0A0M8MAG6_9FLAO|nr:hypothetical protein [Flavobacterium akiainvivens]KOS07013.1 hypothetical protein AM493_13950 [Flavobacterium akiainvivens]SFQ59210.1 hypothetical protein SAMN05444144_10987 [Flavobacterium akiainvivens]